MAWPWDFPHDLLHSLPAGTERFRDPAKEGTWVLSHQGWQFVPDAAIYDLPRARNEGAKTQKEG